MIGQAVRPAIYVQVERSAKGAVQPVDGIRVVSSDDGREPKSSGKEHRGDAGPEQMAMENVYRSLSDDSDQAWQRKDEGCRRGAGQGIGRKAPVVEFSDEGSGVTESHG